MKWKGLMAKKNFIIDFDSTFIKVEAMDLMAEVTLDGRADKSDVIAKIQHYTDLGMEGKMSFQETLEKRIDLLDGHKKHFQPLIEKLEKNVTNSFVSNKSFFELFSQQIYIVSGGFKEYITPITTKYGIPESHVFANDFTYDDQDNIIGYNSENVLSQEGGKVELLKSLHLDGDIYVIGDGYNDFKLKEAGLANKFFAFTENIERAIVTKEADHVTPSFDEFLYTSNLPMNISYPKNRIKVLLLENVHPNAQQMFSDEGYQVEIVSGSLDEEELCEKIKDVSVLGIRSKTQITQKVIDSAKRLIAIGAFCIGTNQIDLKACTKKGVVVFHAPYSNTRSVVELAIGEMIMLSRKTFVQSTNIHKGRWHKSANESNEIRGKKLGIIGYGSIGSQLSVLAENMGMDVYYYDTDEKLALSNATKIDHLDTLLQTCDFITLHVDGNTSNTNLIGEREFELMKDGVIFLNLARGFVVDIKALAKYVKNGKVRGAAVDVYPEEPKASKSAFETQLKGLENVILTPHVGGSTEEAQANIGDFVPNNIINFVNKGNLAASVNIPPMQLPTFDGSHRLIHIHRNEPGIMSKINAVYAKFNLNIVGQYLKTTESIGYVITDIMKDYDDDVINELKKIEHTIKFRVLY